MAGGNPRPPALDCASRSPGTQFLLKSYDAEGMGVVKGGDGRGGGARGCWKRGGEEEMEAEYVNDK